ncbi:MAG: hypothetical protein ACR2RD_16545 [Woeseiaceae bacterium]
MNTGEQGIRHHFRQSGHSRFPFTPTGQFDDVSGVVLAKEIMFALLDDPHVIDGPR